jgi:hypothetical protein
VAVSFCSCPLILLRKGIATSVAETLLHGLAICCYYLKVLISSVDGTVSLSAMARELS